MHSTKAQFYLSQCVGAASKVRATMLQILIPSLNSDIWPAVSNVLYSGIRHCEGGKGGQHRF